MPSAPSPPSSDFTSTRHLRLRAIDLLERDRFASLPLPHAERPFSLPATASRGEDVAEHTEFEAPRPRNRHYSQATHSFRSPARPSPPPGQDGAPSSACLINHSTGPCCGCPRERPLPSGRTLHPGVAHCRPRQSSTTNLSPFFPSPCPPEIPSEEREE